MKNFIVAMLLLIGLCTSVSAQIYGRVNYSSRLSINLEANNYKRSEKALNDFLKNHNIKIQQQEIYQKKLKIEFDIQTLDIYLIDSIINTLGYIVYRDYSYTDNDIAVAKIEGEIKNLQQRKYDGYENSIAEKQAQIAELSKNTNKTFVQIAVTEEDVITDKIKFVNMPGFEYGVLFTENPKKNFTAPYYQSFTLKYLFTRGKSYFTLGLLKASDFPKQDSTLYNEYFMLNFGQDFYTRHLGRGKRRFFNPYTSYQIGCFLANNQNSDNKFIANINVAIGLEWIKTRSFLLDSKVSYFLPIHKDNVNMRGFQVNISANLLF